MKLKVGRKLKNEVKLKADFVGSRWKKTFASLLYLRGLWPAQ